MKQQVKDLAIKIVTNVTELTDLVSHEDDIDVAISVMVERASLTGLTKPTQNTDLELLTMVPNNTVLIDKISDEVVKELAGYRRTLDTMFNYEKQFNDLNFQPKQTNLIPIGADATLEKGLRAGIKKTNYTPSVLLKEYLTNLTKQQSMNTLESTSIDLLFTDKMEGFSKAMRSTGWANVHKTLESLQAFESFDHDGDAKFSPNELSIVIEHAYFVLSAQYDTNKNKEANSKGLIRAGATIESDTAKYVPIYNNAYNKLGAFVLENEQVITKSMTQAYVLSHEETLSEAMVNENKRDVYRRNQYLLDNKLMLIRSIGLENNVHEDKIKDIQQRVIKENLSTRDILLSLFTYGNLTMFLSASEQYSGYDSGDRLIGIAFVVTNWLLSQTDKV